VAGDQELPTITYSVVEIYQPAQNQDPEENWSKNKLNFITQYAHTHIVTVLYLVPVTICTCMSVLIL
jgi:hypothetical protein